MLRVYSFLPYWFQNLKESMDLYHLDMHLSSLEVAEISEYLNGIYSLDDFVTYYRHNRRKKDLILFEKSEHERLVKYKEMNPVQLKEFEKLIFVLAKESLMIPMQFFELAKPSEKSLLSFEKQLGMTPEAIECIVRCVIMHQPKVRALNLKDI